MTQRAGENGQALSGDSWLGELARLVGRTVEALEAELWCSPDGGAWAEGIAAEILGPQNEEIPKARKQASVLFGAVVQRAGIGPAEGLPLVAAFASGMAASAERAEQHPGWDGSDAVLSGYAPYDEALAWVIRAGVEAAHATGQMEPWYTLSHAVAALIERGEAEKVLARVGLAEEGRP